MALSEKAPRNIVVVLPRLPPQHCGLASYTIQLWRMLVDNYDPVLSLDKKSGWSFVVAHHPEESALAFPDAAIDGLPRDADQLWKQLEETDASLIFLQFVCYSFERNGVPAYLFDALEKWRNGDPRRRLAVMFHEAWGHKNPLKKAFWYASRQRAVIQNIVKLADIAATSNGFYKQIFSALAPGKEILVVPIGANFSTEPSPERNSKELLVFGLQRLSAIRIHAKLLKLLASTGSIESLVLAGSTNSGSENDEIALLEELCPNVRLTTCFNFEFDDVPMLVRNCGLSLLDVPSFLLEKSSRFHFACTLAQVSISQKYDAVPGPPLFDGQNYLSYATGREQDIVEALGTPGTIERISPAALELSKTHFSWNEIARTWESLLEFAE